MSEWWTYDPAELLMFAPRTYWRMVERYNAAFWPGVVLAWVTGLGVWWLASRGQLLAHRFALAVLALAWLWVGWAFHWQRYAEIFLSGPWLAAACWLAAALLAAGAVSPGPAPLRPHAVGHALAGAGLLLYPLAGTLFGRPLVQVEVFGWMPDPTAVVTLGVLLLAASGWRMVALSVLPILLLLWGWGTQWVMAG
jgi:hypothetical protein